jgi:RNA-directed DNA polymerase
MLNFGQQETLPSFYGGKTMSTDIARIRRKAEEDKKFVFNSLFHHVSDVDNLRHCYNELDAKKAPGIDKMTKAKYGENLEENLKALSDKLANMGYIPPPSRRSYIPKACSDKMRPLGISCFEAKIVEKSMKEVLEQIYEPVFSESSYGYRPGRSQHDAVDALGKCIQWKYVNWIAEADIKGFFDHVNHEWLMKFLEHRIADQRVLRMIWRFLKSGIMEDGLVKPSDEGTPQGSILSPLLSNIYLHYVLDLWFEVKMPQLVAGQAFLFRYADDFVACFQTRLAAEKYLEALRERLRNFNLEVANEKTKMLAFGRYAQKNAEKFGKKPETFDFLGFTFYCGKTRYGVFKVVRKTRKKKFTQKLKEFSEWMQENRNKLTTKQILKTAKAKWQGHLNYYAITDNWSSCAAYGHWLERILFKWLNRRSQKKSYTWDGFRKLLDQIKWTKTKIKVNMSPFDKSGLKTA